MRTVFNYRKALREPKKIQQLTENYSLPFAVELIPVINFFIFLGITFIVGYNIRKAFPHAFDNSWFIFLIGIPLLLAYLVTKIKIEGKNIYLYFVDVVKYFLSIKIPKKRFCNDKQVEWMNDTKILFKKCVKVVGKSNGEIKNANENNEREFIVNENGRRVGVLSYKEPVHTNAKQKSS
ncbi:conjugal transfer protein [Virgibacillus sp. AGTR]|uniref:conjugal transfer protein n=1 Tax=Virgibacillus sp. AGTR TaxID=2812055 RepID=UPI001D15F3B7|nr:conjugal transfer protein [Virgibacillus sp. AGTR]MCC2251781.1 conjugal transfer protein [Virgibacillus sp. AGTR]